MRAVWIIGVLMLGPHWTASASEQQRLLLAGGSLPICSSFSANQCKTRNFDSNYRSNVVYEIDADSMARLQSTSSPALRRLGLLVAAYWQEQQTPFRGDRRALRDALAGVALTRSGASVGQRVAAFGLEGYQKRFADDPVVLTGDSWWQSVANDTFASAMSLLEAPQTGANGGRKTERVDVADSRNRHAVAVFETFVDMARARSDEASPLILVSTASSTDSFEAVDFYTGVFAQLGAQSHWLPLDRVLQAAIEQDRCDALDAMRVEVAGLYQRATLYPDLAALQQDACDASGDALLALLDQAGGLFLNGGDQSLTRAAWFTSDGQPTAWLKRLRERYHAGDLAVGGTSAGTAVQAGPKAPMISNGDPMQALLSVAKEAPPPIPGCARAGRCEGMDPGQLTYNGEGGLGLFGLGLIDTHFSEREREWRLQALASQTGAAQAWGVDETTALVVGVTDDRHHLRVVGENGVWRMHALTSGVLERRVGQCQFGPARLDYGQAPSEWLMSEDGVAPMAAPQACFRRPWQPSQVLPREALANGHDALRRDEVVTLDRKLSKGTARWCWYRDEKTQLSENGYRNLNAVVVVEGSPLCVNAIEPR